MKKIAIIGSSGSIGVQTIEVIQKHLKGFKIVALCVRSSKRVLEEQARLARPDFVAIEDDIELDLPAGINGLHGEGSGLKALEECGADIAVVAASGFAGLKYSLKAVELGMALALANKETLVCGGELIMPKVNTLVPIDSEHSAIWQCLNFKRNAPFERLVITASGGPFRGRKFETLAKVTPGEALNHPTWSMGAKITIDSATLLNKGYEVIEAHYLYNAPYDKIQTVIHPQSIVHSMVQFADGATLAQLSYPTMKLPIMIALSYPKRVKSDLKQLDFTEAMSLEFLPLVREDYPLYDLALTCGEEGGILPAALNAASEEAVAAFLKGGIGFMQIYSVADKVVSLTQNASAASYAAVEEADLKARALAQKIIKEA